MTAMAEQASRNALDLLGKSWGYDPEYVALPVDPIAIAQSLGIQVWTAKIEPGVAGMLVKRPGEDPEIYLNADDSVNRQRFTCAHEIGHYVQRSQSDREAWEFVDRRAHLAATGTDPVEMYANAFAAELLMPASAVKRSARAGSSPAALAVEFRVSVEAMTHRMNNLNSLR